MNQEIMRMVHDYRKLVIAGDRFAPHLTDEDKVLIDSWLASQRTAVNPDLDAWQALLLEGKPFFLRELENLLAGRMVEMVEYCASKISWLSSDDVKREFPILNDQGVAFLLNAADPSILATYAGKFPLLLNMSTRMDVWRLETVKQDTLKIAKASVADVIWSAFREWTTKGAKLCQARERLTDLLSICLAKS